MGSNFTARYPFIFVSPVQVKTGCRSAVATLKQQLQDVRNTLVSWHLKALLRYVEEAKVSYTQRSTLGIFPILRAGLWGS